MWVFCCLKIMIDNKMYIQIILMFMLNNAWRGKKVKFIVFFVWFVFVFVVLVVFFLVGNLDMLLFLL